MASENVYQELKNALTELKKVLDSPEYNAIAEAITKLAVVFPVIVELIDKLIALLKQLRQAITDLNVTGIAGLDKVAQVTDAATAVAKAAQVLLPANKQEGVNEVMKVLDQISGFPTLGTVKDDLTKLIDDINGKLAGLKPKP